MNRIDALEKALAGITEVVYSMASLDAQKKIDDIMDEWAGEKKPQAITHKRNE